MSIYNTKYFGKISIEKETESIELEYKNNKIHIVFLNFNNVSADDIFFTDPDFKYQIDIREAYIKYCVDNIDSYPYIDEKSREFFIDNFTKGEMIRSYFESYFDKFDKEQIFKIFGVKTLDEHTIKNIVEKLDYPNMCLEYDQGHIITCVDYKISDLSSENIISLQMDDSFGIIAYGKHPRTQERGRGNA